MKFFYHMWSSFSFDGFLSTFNTCIQLRNMNEILRLYEGAKRPKCNPDFTNEIGANDLILRPALYR